MKIQEYKQSAYGGGRPLLNENGWEHGEEFYAVNRQDMQRIVNVLRDLHQDVAYLYSKLIKSDKEIEPLVSMDCATKILKEIEDLTPPRDRKKGPKFL